MTTSLAAQLAAQAANSVASLDLQLQKSAHSKSLIWEPKDAAVQTLQKLYTICAEAFGDLCALDPRLLRFGSTLFDKESQGIDRTTKTAAENDALDREIEAFLRIAGRWLNLQITVRSVEWLVRRFRILDMNTEFLITTFLPWHTLPVFRNLLDILPRRLPQIYHFLTPYTKSTMTVPREHLVDQAIRNRDFVTKLSSYTIDACKSGQGHHALVVLWGTVISQALGARIDRGRSGRVGKQTENDETLLLLYVPIIGKALLVKKDPSLQIAAYMAASIYAAKGDLADAALTAFMEQVVAGWTNDSVEPGIECLSILAQQRSPKQLSRKVTKALLKVPHLPQVLAQVAQTLAVDRLANGLCLALIIERFTKKRDAAMLRIVEDILRANILKPEQISVIYKSLLVVAHKLDDQSVESGECRKRLAETVTSLSQAPGDLGEAIQKSLASVDLDMEQLELKLSTSLRRSQAHLQITSKDDIETHVSLGAEDEPKSRITEISSRLGDRPQFTSSFFASSSKPIFVDLCELFVLVTADEQSTCDFDDLPVLGRDSAVECPAYLSFFMRVWCGPYPALVRVRALEKAKGLLKSIPDTIVDFQNLFPYCIVALSDSSKKVRRAAADLMGIIGELFQKERSQGDSWGSKDLYEPGPGLEPLSREYCRKLTTRVVSSLEECIMSPEHIHTVLKACVDSVKDGESKKKGLSRSIRLAIVQFLATHVVHSPLVTLKTRLLEALNHSRGVSATSRTSLLLPVIKWWACLSSRTATDMTAAEQVDEDHANATFVGIVAANEVDGLKVLFDFLEQKACIERPGLIRAIFSHLTSLWPYMKEPAQGHVAETMLDFCFGDNLIPDTVVGESMHFLRTVELSSQVLATFLEKLGDLPRIPSGASPSKKRRHSSSSDNAAPGVDFHHQVNDMLPKTTFILELVEGSNPASHPELLNALVGTLSELHHYKVYIGSEVNYLQNLVLKSLLEMVPAYKESRELKIDNTLGHGDVLIDCIRKSSSPAVKNSALLLVAALANAVPGLIINSIMSLFSLLGGPGLAQSDDYSAHVLNETIKSVIPPLIASLRRQQRNTLFGTVELLSHFIVAYSNISSHRKTALFNSLIETLGPDEFMFAIIAMLVDRYGATDDVASFATETLGSQGVETQLQTVYKLLELIADIFKPKPAMATKLLRREEEDDYEPFEASSGQMSLLPRLLSGRKLRSEVGVIVEKDDMEASKTRELYSGILEQILLLADVVKSSKTHHAWCGDALANLLNLLSIGEFIKAVESLLDRPNIVLRQRVLRALEVRVDGENRTDPRACAALLAFLPTLTAVIRDSPDIHYKHTAVACVDKISEKYGRKDIEAVTAAASTISGEHCLGEADGKLRNMALLCLASLVDVLQAAIVPIIPETVPKTVDYIEGSLKSAQTNTSLHNAGYHFLVALAQHLPYMMTGKYLDRVINVSLLSASSELDTECGEIRRECLELLARQVDGKAIFSCLQRCWEKAATSSFHAIQEYLQVLGMALDQHPKSVISRNLSSLSSIFTGALDLRRLAYAKGDIALGDIEEVEDVVNQVAIKMIFKLNDATFRPLFSELVDWALSCSKEDTNGQVARQQSFYAFAFSFFENIKSAATNYATYILDNAVKVLTTAELKDELQANLWRTVLVTLTKCFEHDGSDFWQAPANFGAIQPALTSQVARASAVDLTGELIPAIVELAAAADSQDHYKELNTTILKQLRSEDGAVRLAAVLCQQALVDRHGDEWLQALPEMLPYISELQTDDDDDVERETHRWITKIEAVLGEPLDAMLQ